MHLSLAGLCTSGFPRSITIDRGAKFDSDLLHQLIHFLGWNCTTSNHLDANDLVEHFHRQLKASCCTPAISNQYVEGSLWSLQSVKEDLGRGMAKLVYQPVHPRGTFL